MSDLTQQVFFGASIRGFNVSAGWGSQLSQLTIDLVEDPSNGDAFLPNPIGTPAYFNYHGFSFGGIVQKYSRSGSQQGDPLYQVILVDPREILDGVQLIIEGYTGPTNSVPNLYNVYGYLESTFGFGGSRVNETGMPWQLLRDGFLALNVTSGILFRGQTYYVDLTSLPNLASDYRIGGGSNISVMDFISRVCEDSACDFFFSLIQGVLGENIIKVYTVSRAIQPIFGLITDFISNTEGAVGHEIGLELRNEVTSKFLVGGPICQLYFMYDDEGDEENLIDNTILPFWGFDANRNMITGTFNEEDEDNYSFTLDSRSVNVVGVGEFYETDVGEMRAAIGGQASWESYILAHEGEEGPHFNKATQLGLIGNVKAALVGVLADKASTVESFKKLDLRDLAPFLGKGIIAASSALEEGSLHEENIRRLYGYVVSFAQEYYGRKYIVDLPDVSVKRDVDTNQLSFSLEPVEGGFLEEELIDTAVGLKLLPPDVNAVTIPDGRIGAYVRFDDVTNLDLSALNEDDFVFGDDCIFIKCDVEKRVYFLNDNDITAPKAIITLPCPIYPKAENGIDLIGVLRPILNDHADSLGMDETARKAAIKEIVGRFGGEQILFGWAGLAITPNVAIIPLQSNILTYGPWSATGATGAVTFEQDPTLNPWNYGSFEAMNLVGQSKVVDAISEQQVSEAGTIEVPDAPAYSLGAELLAGGPYITGINCSIGLNGVTTVYRMETWTQRFGKFYKQNADRVTRLSQQLQGQRRLLRELLKTPARGSKFYENRKNVIIDNPRLKNTSASTYIGGEIIKNEDNQLGRVNISIIPQYHAQTQLGNNYDKKAFMSLDGLFVPFSTSTSASGLPHYETATASGVSGRSNLELNPFGSGGNIRVIAKGSGLNETTDLVNDISSEQRGLAWRGPPILAGWGYDTNGKPVPNSNETTPTDNFLTNYQNKPDQWKCGPLDVKWDRTRKVWATGGSSFRVAILNTPLFHGVYASGQFVTPTFDFSESLTGWARESGSIKIYDGLIGEDNNILYPISPSGARVFISQEQSSQKWFVISASVF